MADLPLHRFEDYGRLSASERKALVGMIDAPHVIEKGHPIQREDVSVTGFFILLSGWAAAAVTVPDGRQQIMKIHLPGDALGTPGMAMQRTTEELFALSAVEVAHVSLANFGKLFDDHPRLVARFMLSIQQERIALMDRLASVGRTSAEARTAAFLIDLMVRLEPLGLVEDNSFDVLVTHDQIADVLGLTGVHVNRVLRVFSDAGLLKRDGKRFSLLDVDRLTKLSARPARQPFADQAWLPAQR